MYEELVKSLQSCPDAEYGCSRCKYKNSLGCREKLMSDAANAIEELSSAGSIYGKAWTLGYDAGRDENSPHWIPVAERYPEIDRENSCFEYVVMLENGTYCIAEYVQDIHGKKFFECDRLLPNGASFGRVTHWMPLPSAPEPPKEET